MGGVRQELSLMVASDMHPGCLHEKLGRLQRQQRAGEAIPQVHYKINPASLDVLADSLQCGEVSMDVTDNGDAHVYGGFHWG